MTAPRISVVIVTYQSAAQIDACLAALECAHSSEMQIVVVDNGSTDDSARRAARYEGVEVVCCADNLGFATAANLGADRSRGHNLLFLNPDTVIHPNCVSAMEQHLRDPRVGVVGCKIYAADGRTLQHVGGILRPNAITEHVGRGEPDVGQFDDVRRVTYVSGAAMLLSMETWRRLGGFDERFWPLYYEDVDLCARARELGLEVMVEPNATLRHHEGASSWEDGHEAPGCSPGPGERFYDAYHANRLRFVWKHLGHWAMVSRFAPSELLWLLRGGARGHVAALMRSYREELCEIGHRTGTPD